MSLKPIGALEATGANGPRLSSQDLTRLIEQSCHQFRAIVHRTLRFGFPSVGRWEDTDDVMQMVLLRLCQSLRLLPPCTEREFFGFACRQMRWQLCDLFRSYFGPFGLGANHESVDLGASIRRSEHADTEPSSMAEWSDFHEAVEKLEPEHREMFDLIWYQQLAAKQAAVLLGVSERRVQRRWQLARQRLQSILLAAGVP